MSTRPNRTQGSIAMTSSRLAADRPRAAACGGSSELRRSSATWPCGTSQEPYEQSLVNQTGISERLPCDSRATDASPPPFGGELDQQDAVEIRSSSQTITSRQTSSRRAAARRGQLPLSMSLLRATRCPRGGIMTKVGSMTTRPVWERALPWSPLGNPGRVVFRLATSGLEHVASKAGQRSSSAHGRLWAHRVGGRSV